MEVALYKKMRITLHLKLLLPFPRYFIVCYAFSASLTLLEYLIGKGGVTKNRIQNETGATIRIPSATSDSEEIGTSFLSCTHIASFVSCERTD